MRSRPRTARAPEVSAGSAGHWAPFFHGAVSATHYAFMSCENAFHVCNVSLHFRLYRIL